MRWDKIVKKNLKYVLYILPRKKLGTPQMLYWICRVQKCKNVLLAKLPDMSSHSANIEKKYNKLSNKL